MRWKKRLTALAGVLLLLWPAPAVSAVSGSVGYVFGSMDPNYLGSESRYQLQYSIPTVVDTGVKTNISLTLFVTELSGYKYQSLEQDLRIIFITATNKTLYFDTKQVNRTFYEGARWGPFNLSITIDGNQVGLGPGGSTNATVYARLIVYERYVDPKFPFQVNDGATMPLGTVQLMNGSPGTLSSGERLAGSAAVALLVVLALLIASVTYRRIRRKAAGTRRF